jgi:hypothetical protein
VQLPSHSSELHWSWACEAHPLNTSPDLRGRMMRPPQLSELQWLLILLLGRGGPHTWECGPLAPLCCRLVVRGASAKCTPACVTEQSTPPCGLRTVSLPPLASNATGEASSVWLASVNAALSAVTRQWPWTSATRRVTRCIICAARQMACENDHPALSKTGAKTAARLRSCLQPKLSTF